MQSPPTTYNRSLLVLVTLATGALAVEGGQFSDPGSPILISTVACSGEEDSLLDCSPDMLPTSTLCSDGQVAGVVCQG